MSTRQDKTGVTGLGGVNTSTEELHATAVEAQQDVQNAHSADGVLPCALKAKSKSAFSLTALSFQEFLAPGAEKEKSKITYQISDPDGVVNGGVLRILDGAGNVWMRELTKAELLHGTVNIPWSGAIPGTKRSTDFPDGYVTLEFSPYRINVRITGDGKPGAAAETTTFKVEMHSIDLSLGDRNVLKKQLHTDVFDTIGSLPAAESADPKKLHLVSNRFSNKEGDDKHDNPDSFEEHRKLWGDGPPIPIHARLWLKSSTSPEKLLAPLALGQTVVLWDYSIPKKKLTGIASRAARFIEDAQNRLKDASLPPGDNCPDDLGGKRGVSGNPPAVFPASSTFNTNEIAGFPYTVGAARNRKWAAFSHPVKDGERQGTTGVIFRPSRIAGDSYKIAACVGVREHLDKVGEIEPMVTAQTGAFEIWRDIDIIEIFYKSQAAELNFDTINTYYGQAYTRVVNKAGGGKAMNKDAYNNAIAAALVILKDDLWVQCIDTSQDHFGASPGLTCVSRKTFDNRVEGVVSGEEIRERLSMSVEAFQQLGQDDQKRTETETEIKQARLRKAYGGSFAAEKEADDAYRSKSDMTCAKVIKEAANILMKDVQAERTGERGGDGIVVFCFSWASNNASDSTDGIRGMAVSNVQGSKKNATSSKAAYIQFATRAWYSQKYAGGTHDLSKTVAHELGHLLFLPHTETEMGQAEDADAHDRSDDSCLMGYNYKVERNLCGYCQLRLRGWNHTRLKSGATNSVAPAVELSGPAPAGGVRQTVEIKNSGKGPLRIIKIIRAGGDFNDFDVDATEACAQPVSPDGTATFTVSRKATSSGSRYVIVNVVSNAPGSPHPVQVSSDARNLAISVTTDLLEFFDVGRGTASKPLSFEIQNTGQAPVYIHRLELKGLDTFDFEVKEPPKDKLLAASSDPVLVELICKPRALGPKSANLYIHSTAAGSPHVIGCKADCVLVVVPKPKLELSTRSLDFGRAAMGTSVEREFTIEKERGSDLVLTLKKVVLDNSEFKIANPPAENTPLDNAITLKVVFKPTKNSTSSDDIAIVSNAAGSPHSVKLRGVGTTGSPLTFKWGDKTRFQTNVAGVLTRSLKISNASAKPIRVSSIVIKGSDGEISPDFTSTLPPGPVPARGEVQVTISFQPSQAGKRTGTLVLTCDGEDSPEPLNLVGEGT